MPILRGRNLTSASPRRYALGALPVLRYELQHPGPVSDLENDHALIAVDGDHLDGNLAGLWF
jgi:hypothetical protein